MELQPAKSKWSSYAKAYPSSFDSLPVAVRDSRARRDSTTGLERIDGRRGPQRKGLPERDGDRKPPCQAPCLRNPRRVGRKESPGPPGGGAGPADDWRSVHNRLQQECRRSLMLNRVTASAALLVLCSVSPAAAQSTQAQ